MANFAVILPAAGKSSRYKDANYKKPFAPLEGRAVWLHSAEKFLARADVKQLIVVLDDADRQQRLVQSMIDHTQHLLVESPYVRKEYMKDLDTSSLETYERSSAEYRKRFRHEVIGSVGIELASIDKARPRTRQSYQGEGWKGYDVVLDLYGKEGQGEDVFAYGILLWPEGMQPGDPLQ